MLCLRKPQIEIFIEGKAAGIEQFRKGDSLARVIEDVAGEAANAAEMKAAAT